MHRFYRFSNRRAKWIVPAIALASIALCTGYLGRRLYHARFEFANQPASTARPSDQGDADRSKPSKLVDPTDMPQVTPQDVPVETTPDSK